MVMLTSDRAVARRDLLAAHHSIPSGCPGEILMGLKASASQHARRGRAAPSPAESDQVDPRRCAVIGMTACLAGGSYRGRYRKDAPEAVGPSGPPAIQPQDDTNGKHSRPAGGPSLRAARQAGDRRRRFARGLRISLGDLRLIRLAGLPARRMSISPAGSYLAALAR